MHNAHKEHLLHKILAGSAFTFALALLPIANYYFRQTPAEPGTVAGVSTERPAALSSIRASPALPKSFAECMADKQLELDGLDQLQATWQAAYARQISEDSSQASIDASTTKYQKEFVAVQARRTAVEAHSCS